MSGVAHSYVLPEIGPAHPILSLAEKPTPEANMTKQSEPGSLAHHLGHLAVDADDLEAFLTRQHDDAGDIHPEALGKSKRLATSLRDVIHALTEHEHLAMGADDVWKALTVKHAEHDDSTIT